MYGASWPVMVWDLMMMSLRILFRAWPMWMWPLAYGGPSCKMKAPVPRRRSRIARYSASASQRASCAGSCRARAAFMGKSVAGRFSVSRYALEESDMPDPNKRGRDVSTPRGMRGGEGGRRNDPLGGGAVGGRGPLRRAEVHPA